MFPDIDARSQTVEHRTLVPRIKDADDRVSNTWRPPTVDKRSEDADAAVSNTWSSDIPSVVERDDDWINFERVRLAVIQRDSAINAVSNS